MKINQLLLLIASFLNFNKVLAFAVLSGATNKREISPLLVSKSSTSIIQPSTAETARLQLNRLFEPKMGTMSRTERISRVFSSWIFLFLAKSIALASPMYFRALVDRFSDVKIATRDEILGLSTLGLIAGYGGSKLASGLVQFLCDNILSPATILT